MKKTIITKIVAIASTIAISISPTGLFSSAATTADATVYKFMQSDTDSLGTFFSLEMHVNHIGQTFTTGNVYSSFETSQTVPTNNYVYLNALFSSSYKASDTESAYVDNMTSALYIGMAEPDSIYETTFYHLYNFNRERVVNEVVTMSRISEDEGMNGNLGKPYRSLVTKRHYDFMMTRSRSWIIDHGYDYLDN